MISPFIIEHNQQSKNLMLERYPANQVNRSLQAWDAADEYLFNYVSEHYIAKHQLAPNSKILVFNDSFGALSLALNQYQVTSVSDSKVSQLGVTHNLHLNQLSDENISQLTSLDELPSSTQIVLYKIPKNKAFMIEQLIRIKNTLPSSIIFIAADKAKQIQKSTLALFEKYLGTTTTSLAVKKARLVFCQLDATQTHQIPEAISWPLAHSSIRVSNLANVFAREKLDIGARHFIENLGELKNKTNIIDLGCGNGVVGLSILAQHPDAKVTFVDESYMAVASAKLNVTTNFPELIDNCQFITSDCLADFDTSSVDAIYCNPPFHQQNATTDHIAWQMFKDSLAVLKKGGELRIVGNRQLGYHIKLKRLFNNCKVIASNKKFVTLSSIKK